MECQFCKKTFNSTRGTKIHESKCPKKNQPAVEEIKVEEPVVEEIKVEEPAVEEIKVEEPAVEEIKVEEPVVEESVADAQSDEKIEEMSFELSEDAEWSADQSENVHCNCCGKIVCDFQNAQVVCGSCLIAQPTNTDEVKVEREVVSEDLHNQTVVEFRPICDEKKLLVYAPTETQSRRYLTVENIAFQRVQNGVHDTIELSQWTYRNTVFDLEAMVHGTERNKHSIFAGENLSGEKLSRSDVEVMFQANPHVSESKKFATKLLLDYSPVFVSKRPAILFVDTETSARDGIYNAIPQPENPDHRVCIIQFLLDAGEEKPTQFLYHIEGYTYDRDFLAQRFAKVNLVFQSFASERTMVDAFWSFVLGLSGQVIFTGFNACHKEVRAVGEHKDMERGFVGYDLRWLTSRTSLKFTPKNAQVSLGNTLGMYTVSQIAELPNVLCVDYQAVLLRSMTPSEISKLPSCSLKEILGVLDLSAETKRVLKEDQKIYDLQRNMHLQCNPLEDRVDMTKDMVYSINDTVCLWECETLRASLEDQTVAIVDSEQVGLWCASVFTSNQLNQLELNRSRVKAGLPYLIRALDNNEPKFMGAYTNNDESYMGKVHRLIDCLDYNSLYPQTSLYFHISHENLRGVFPETETVQFDKQTHAFVEVSDDHRWKRCAQRMFAVYEKKDALLLQLFRNGLARRQELKDKTEQAKREAKRLEDAGQFEEARVQKALARKYNSRQAIQKAKNNAHYGGLGSRASPFYNYVIASSVTAGARFALAMANFSIHQTLGNTEGKEIEGRELMTQVEVVIDEKDADGNVVTQEVTVMVGKKEKKKAVPRKVVVKEWVRNYFNTSGNRILQNDTDSAFFVFESSVLGKILRSKPEHFATAFGNFDVVLRNRLNENIRRSGQTDFTLLTEEDLSAVVVPDADQICLKMVAEELIVAQFCSYAKKSYFRIDAGNWKGQTFYQHFGETVRAITDENGKFVLGKVQQAIADKRLNDIVIKGVQWTNFHDDFRKEIKAMFLEVLVADGDFFPVKMSYKERFLQEFRNALETLHHAKLEKYATRVKRSGKSGKALALQTRYPEITDNYVYVLPCKRFAGLQQKAGDLIIPVERVTIENRHLVDMTRVLDAFESQCTKFFEPVQGSRVKEQRQELYDNMAQNEVMLRVETVKSKQALHATMVPAEVDAFVKRNAMNTVHEVIIRPVAKLFFDVDEKLDAPVKFNLASFERAVTARLLASDYDVRDLKMFVSERIDTREKVSYHIAFNIVLPLTLQAIIASQLKRQFPAIDEQLYAIGKTIRVNGSKKIKDGKVDETSLLVSRHEYADTLVTNIDGYQTHENQIALSADKIVNFSTEVPQTWITGHEPAEFQSVFARLVVLPETATKFFKTCSVKHGHVCPACEQYHSSDCDWKVSLYQTQKEYKIRCYKDRATGGESLWACPISKEQKKERRALQKNKGLDTTTEFAYKRLVPTQNSKHVSFKVGAHPLLCVKAQMGAGKTHCLIEFLKDFLPTHTVVMLSVRNTLTSSWKARYESAGLRVVDYRDSFGQIVPQEGEIVVIQVDSLSRLQGAPDMLVLDEVESIISQTNSTQLRNATAIKLKFMDLCKNSTQVVAMDGQLLESTVEVLEYLTGNSSEVVWNNRKTYADYRATLRRFSRGGSDHLVSAFLKAVEEGKRIVGHINSLTMLETVAKAIADKFPGKKVVTYHGDNNRVEGDGPNARYHYQRKREDLADVNTAFETADVLLWTGTISAGVDYSGEHFEENISCFSSNCNTAQAFCQGLFRVRHLKAKSMTIYLEKTDVSFECAPANVFKEWRDNTSRFDVAGDNLNSQLFNFQIWCHAYERAIKGRPNDYVIATLNQMGIKSVEENLSKIEEESKEIAKGLDLNLTGKVSGKMIVASEPVQSLAVDYWMERSDAKAQQLLENNATVANLTENLRVLSFVATVHNKDLQTAGLLGHEAKFVGETPQQFADRKAKLTTTINEKLEALKAKGEAHIEDLVGQFQSYASYRNRFDGIVGRIDSGNAWDTPLEKLEQTVKQAVDNNQLQYKAGQKLRDSTQSDVLVAKDGNTVILARKFLDALVSGDKANAQNLAKECGYEKFENWRHILVALGLHLTKEDKRVQVNGKRVRAYTIVIRPFFSEQVVAKIEGFIPK